ncbi:MAG: SLC13 family permease [Deltaproteobacteria bacterium]|nr:SLC13 family permease [Deltaproteobacteria bacterium]
MPVDAWVMLGILIIMFVFLAWDRFPAWLVFMGTLTTAMTLRLAPAEALLTGFSNTGVMTVAVLFPVAAGMYATGAISLLSQKLIGRPSSLTAAQLRIFPPIALGSAVLNNTPMVAMMIPVVRDLARTTGLAGSKIFMGLSFMAILGGSMTVIGSSVNLIIAGLVSTAMDRGELAGMAPLRIFDPLWIGLPATVAGFAFMILVGTRLLPDRTDQDGAGVPKRMYRSELAVEENSFLVGKTLLEAGFARPIGYTLEGIRRQGTPVEIAPNLRLAAGDILTFYAQADVLPGLWTTLGLVPVLATPQKTKRHQHHLVEVVISSQSPAIGHRIADLPLPDSPYEMMLVGISRQGQAPSQPLAELRLEPGDAAIIEVGDTFFYENRRETDFTLTRRVEGYRVQRVDRALSATVITAAMIAVATTGLMSMLNAALLATAAMLLTGCLTSSRVWRSLDWQTIVVLGAAVGLEAAVTGSGLSAAIAHLIASIGGSSPMLSLTAVYVGTILMTNVITNAAAAAFMFPVALSLANSLGVSFMPFAMVLMSAATSAFINPAGFQTNLMVQEPGGYTFWDFARVGLPLTIIVGAVVLSVAPLVYGF